MSIRSRVLHTPHDLFYPADGSERESNKQWRILSLHYLDMCAPRRTNCRMDIGKDTDCPID